MALTQLAAAPYKSPLLEAGLLAAKWLQWMQLTLLARLQLCAYQVTSPRVLTAQQAAIGTTALVAAASAGLYRVHWYARITQAATTSSSLTVTITTTDGGITVSQSGPALTGNTTATVQSGTAIIRADGGAPISFSTTYASVGGTPMQHRLDLTVEQLG